MKDWKDYIGKEKSPAPPTTKPEEETLQEAGLRIGQETVDGMNKRDPNQQVKA